MPYFKLTPEHIADYQKNGYIIVENLLSKEENTRLSQAAFGDKNILKHAFELDDKAGRKTRLTEWYFPKNDTYGLLTKSRRMVESVDKLMDGNGKVCHFHSKLMQKEPKVGGAWEWHQDYGYWYKKEFLFPDQMISVMVAITESTRENGCLQVIKGSHKMGRVEHGLSGEQTGASPRYVELALKTMDLVYVALKPGDALFFHSNLLHRSDANLSDKPRWTLISCYNRNSNIPYNVPSKSSVTPLETVPDEALLEWKTKEIDETASFAKRD